MSRDRLVALIAACAALAGVAALFLYFLWPSALLDGSRLDSFAFGPQGSNYREFTVHGRDDMDGLVDRVVEAVNAAPLSSVRVEAAEGRLVLILFRDDGLQFHLLEGDDRHVGLAEGDGSFVGSLESPALATLIGGLAAEVRR